MDAFVRKRKAVKGGRNNKRKQKTQSKKKGPSEIDDKSRKCPEGIAIAQLKKEAAESHGKALNETNKDTRPDDHNGGINDTDKTNTEGGNTVDSDQSIT